MHVHLNVKFCSDIYIYIFIYLFSYLTGYITDVHTDAYKPLYIQRCYSGQISIDILASREVLVRISNT